MKQIKFAPLFEAWKDGTGFVDSRHENDFVLVDNLYSEKLEAQRYADSNRGNYPYCTTGEVVRVKVTLEILKNEK